MKTKTIELTGAALDWAVAKCEGEQDYQTLSTEVSKEEVRALLLLLAKRGSYSPSTNWAQGGPIIEREKVNLVYRPDINCVSQEIFPRWIASTVEQGAEGPTPLIAAMRCYVASKFGHEIDVFEELTS